MNVTSRTDGPPLLRVQDLTKSFVARRSAFGRPTATVKAVDGLSFDVASGETLALVGESGCGKSTVGRLVMRLLDPDAGSIAIDGQELGQLTQQAMRPFRRRVQIIFQDPYASLNPRMTVGQMLAEPLMLHGIGTARDRRARVTALLDLVGLGPQQAARYPHEFSGGQRQRVAIARALAVEPDIIVCDEAVSALDVSIRAQILNLLEELQARLGLAYIFISHDLGVVRHVADRVAVMYLGRIVETGPVDAVFDDPRHPYTRTLLSAIPVASPGQRHDRPSQDGEAPSPLNPPSGCHFRTRCPHAAEICAEQRPPLETVGGVKPLDIGGGVKPLDIGGGAQASACHFHATLPPWTARTGSAAIDPRLERLFSAFADRGASLAR